MAELKAQKVVPVKNKPAKSQSGPSGTPPKGGDGSRLFGGSVDDRYRCVKPGQPYSGA